MWGFTFKDEEEADNLIGSVITNYTKKRWKIRSAIKQKRPQQGSSQLGGDQTHLGTWEASEGPGLSFHIKPGPLCALLSPAADSDTH